MIYHICIYIYIYISYIIRPRAATPFIGGGRTGCIMYSFIWLNLQTVLRHHASVHYSGAD